MLSYKAGQQVGNAMAITEPQHGTQGCCCPEAPSWAPLGSLVPRTLGLLD